MSAAIPLSSKLNWQTPPLNTYCYVIKSYNFFVIVLFYSSLIETLFFKIYIYLSFSNTFNSNCCISFYNFYIFQVYIFGFRPSTFLLRILFFYSISYNCLFKFMFSCIIYPTLCIDSFKTKEPLAKGDIIYFSSFSVVLR